MAERILLVTHPNRSETKNAASELIASCGDQMEFFSMQDIDGAKQVTGDTLPDGLELAVVFGGDGTILRAAELIRGRDIPILGVNLGHVGFLAQVEMPSLAELASLIAARKYTTEARLLVEYKIHRDGKILNTGFALNEVVV